MRVTRNGNWAKDWSNYNGRAATTYYRKTEVVKALRHFGHTGEESPRAEINPYSNAAYLVSQNVTPYRVTYHD